MKMNLVSFWGGTTLQPVFSEISRTERESFESDLKMREIH